MADLVDSRARAHEAQVYAGPMPTPSPLSPVTLAYVLGNLSARSGGAVPGRVTALAGALHEQGNLDVLLAELDTELADALSFLIGMDASRFKHPKRAPAALENADTSGS